jgi:hypothetical protein
VGEQPPVAEVKKWKLKDNVEEFEVDEEELKNGHLRFRDYTRKTQAVAEDRKAVAAEKAALAEREQKINALLSDAENVAQYYEFLTGKKLTPAQEARVEQGLTPTAGTPRGDEVATLDEAQKLAKTQVDGLRADLEKEMLEKVARTQAWTQEQILAAQHAVEMKRNAAVYESEINATISALATEHPSLSHAYDKEELEQLLVADVMKHEPKSMGEAKKLLIDAAKSRAERLDKSFVQRQKEAAVGKQNLVDNGIEPAGGVAPGIPATKHKLGDKALTQSAIAFMEASKNR